MSRALLVLCLTTGFALAASGCGGSSHTTSGSRAARTLTDLHSVRQLRSAFNSASGELRLIVLVSPT